jgi:predicted tellurium resistance membrane protein TerC
MDWLIALVTLTALEIVLGIDNIVFISILCGKLPPAQRAMARTAGLAAAMVTRLLLLLSLSWVLSLTHPVFQLTDLGVPESWLQGNNIDSENELKRELAQHAAEEINDISVRDLILLVGGLFLIGNSVIEIHHKLEGHEESHETAGHASLWGVLIQIAILDIIFSLDSVITAVGMAKDLWVMAAAVVLAVMVMMLFAGAVERFVSKYPTVKMLALSFLILIGVLLVAEGIGTPVNKGYIYFAMAFALVVEMLNIRIRGKGHSVA